MTTRPSVSSLARRKLNRVSSSRIHGQLDQRANGQVPSSTQTLRIAMLKSELTPILVHVDGLQGLAAREDEGVVLVVGFTLPQQDRARQLHLVLLHNTVVSLVVPNEDRQVLAVTSGIHVRYLRRACVLRCEAGMSKAGNQESSRKKKAQCGGVSSVRRLGCACS